MTEEKIRVDDPRQVRLDLACGSRCKDGFRGVDKFVGAPEDRWDLLQPWPIADSSVDELHCSHFIEHIPADCNSDGVDKLICFFNEAFRVCKPGASFALQWPALQSVRAFQDPTHRRFIPMETLLYLSKQWRILQGLDHYLGATCDWLVTSCSPTIEQSDQLKSEPVQRQNFRDHWNFAHDFVAVLKAVKQPTVG